MVCIHIGHTNTQGSPNFVRKVFNGSSVSVYIHFEADSDDFQVFLLQLLPMVVEKSSLSVINRLRTLQ